MMSGASSVELRAIAGLRVLVVLAGLTAACAPDPAGEGSAGPPVELPEQRFVTALGEVCVPEQRWEKREPDGWRFRGLASIYCHLEEAGAQPLVVELLPTADTADYRFTVTWDGEPLHDRPLVAGDGLLLEISPDRLSVGTHELEVKRVYRGGDGSAHDNDFASIVYRRGGREHRIEEARAADLALAAEFLRHGVAGPGKERWGGLLFAGPGETTLTLRGEPGAPVRVEIANSSSQSATFALGAAGQRWSAEVAAGEQGVLELALPRAQTELDLSVAGMTDGFFQWSAPDLGTDASTRGPPSLVLITLDTTRRDALSVYGADPEVTPNLAALAEHATVFDRAYSTTSWTLPSHASMMTGLYPWRHGAGFARGFLAGPSPTVAELVRPKGYFSAGFAGGALAASRYGLSRGFQLYRDPDAFETPGDRLTDHALELLDRTYGRPLFLFVNYFDPHAPFAAPAEFQERFGVDELRERIAGTALGAELLASSQTSTAWRQVVGSRLQAGAQVDPDLLEFGRAGYRAEVAFTDQQLGRLFDRLRRDGLYESSLIVVTADHGELLGEYQQFGHAARLDPELTEVPLLIKFPGQTQSHRVDDLVTVTDLFATLVAASGAAVPAEIDGRQLGPEGVLGDEARTYVLMEEHHTRFHPLPEELKIANNLYGIQEKRSRRVVWQGGQTCARRDGTVWREAACPSSAELAFTRLRELIGAPLVGGEAPPALSDEQRAALEALGYL